MAHSSIHCRLQEQFAEAQDVAVGILDVEIPARPGPVLQWPGDQRPAGAHLVIQYRRVADGDMRIEVLVLLAMGTVGLVLGPGLEMNGAPVSADAGVEILVLKVEIEAEASTVILDRAVEVVHQELGRYPSQFAGT
jgi:hypothetical protein